MSKTIERSKRLLQEYAQLSDEELISVLSSTVIEVSKNNQVESIIREMLMGYGYAVEFSADHILISRYNNLLEVAKLRGITVSEECPHIEITMQDIIDGLEAIKERDTKWVEEHSYLYDAYYDGLEQDDTDVKTKKTSTEKIAEIEAFYQNIINDLKSNPNRKVRKNYY